ncbi:MAG: hypothetical protein DRQ55_03015 [Planctomycetota bacterium]|nr:MAG: hypothetical protein DRQ55_03015 [Planctomycetota bacterium]
MRSTLLLLPLLLLAAACASDDVIQKQQTGSIDPRVEQLMHTVCDRARDQRDLSFTVVDSVDEVLPTLQKLQFTHRRKITISRPSLLHVETEGDKAHRSLWKDGETITLADHDHQVYSTLDDPGSIDDMMDMLWNDYGISTPLADIISSDPYAVFMEGALTGTYVGIGFVKDEPCHHLAIQRDKLDFQIWIGERDERLKKLVITYWQQRGEPQFTLWVEKVEAPSRFSATEFKARLPDSYEPIDLQPLLNETGR